MVVGSTTKLLLCLLVVYCCTVVTEGHGTLFDCCKAVSGNPIRKQRVKDYSHQVAGQGCDIDATIFMTRRDKKLCAPHNESWVHELMKHVDDLKIRCMNNNYKEKRCQDLKPK